MEVGLLDALKKMTPDLIFYVGGADPYREDQLGGLALTIEGLQKRDRLVFEHARRRGIPVASTLAGGYARRVADTVRIHVNTIIAARDVVLQESSRWDHLRRFASKSDSRFGGAGVPPVGSWPPLVPLQSPARRQRLTKPS